MTGVLVENALDLVDTKWELEVLGDFHRIHCTRCTVCDPDGCHKLDEAAGRFQRVVGFRRREAVSSTFKNNASAGQVSQ
jgi:hypothetical protein